MTLAVPAAPTPWRDFLVVVASVALVGLGLGALSPLTALTLDARGYGSHVVGLQSAAAALGGIFGAMLPGRVAVMRSLRNCMLCACAFAALATIPNDFSASLPLWAALRVLFGLAIGLLFTSSEAAINHLAPEEARGRLVATYTTTFTVFQLLGPALVATLRPHLAMPFSAVGLLFLLPLPLLAIMRDTRQDGAHEHGERWRQVAPRMPALILGTAFFAAFDTLLLSLLPLYAMRHGLGVNTALLSVSVALVGNATLQLPLGWLSDRYGRARVHAACGLITILTLPLLPLAIDSLLWWPLLYLLGGVAGGIYTLAVVACGERFRGTALVAASGLLATTWSVASCVAPLAAGGLMEVWRPDALIVVLAVAAALFLLGLWRERRAGATDA
jgi:MFS family permease